MNRALSIEESVWVFVQENDQELLSRGLGWVVVS